VKRAPMRALVIAHEPDGPARQVEIRLLERGFDVDTHIVTHEYDKPNQATPWPNADEYDLVLPMGSVRSLTRKDEIDSWVHVELALLRDLHQAGTPMLGVCFGGQLLADALGGSVEVAPVTEIGWFDIQAAGGAENPAGSGPCRGFLSLHIMLILEQYFFIRLLNICSISKINLIY